MTQRALGRAVFYTRDSCGRAEMAPPQYVKWASDQAARLGLTFDGRPEVIEAMIANDKYHCGDLFLDYDVPGDEMSRRGLDSLIREVKRDRSISHVFIPRRDRLARPEDAAEAILLENTLRRLGVTLVFQTGTYGPLAKGQRQNIADLIAGVFEYDQAEKTVRDLSQKMIQAQIGLAEAGYSTGGRPPFGFRRWLVKADGSEVRQLEDKEHVRMPGHHVVWLPLPLDHPQMQLIFRILEMLEGMPASRVAATLTAEGIPSPDAGRSRKDSGVLHKVSGVWHQTTITGIARNPLLLSLVQYGRRSMGKKFRYTPNGPRSVEDDDFREDGKPKVRRNQINDVTLAAGSFAPLVDLERHKALLKELDTRGGSQRGKNRSHDPAKNPLGNRIFDLGCSWPMYRHPHNKTFRYTCGLYQQSHSQQCSHNHIDGPVATKFALSCLRQSVLSPVIQTKLRARLQEFARAEAVADPAERQVNELANKLRQVLADHEKAGENLALAKSPAQYRAVAKTFDSLEAEKVDLEGKLKAAQQRRSQTSDPQAEVKKAMAVLERLTELAADDSKLASIGEAFRIVNVRLFLAFKPVQLTKRVVNRLANGIVTFGSAPAPIDLYQGRTSRQYLKQAAIVAASPEGSIQGPPDPEAGREENSSGNVNRGDRI